MKKIPGFNKKELDTRIKDIQRSPPEVIKLKYTDMTLEVNPTMFNEDSVWVRNENVEGDGYYRTQKIKLKTPDLLIQFSCEVENELKVGACYLTDNCKILLYATDRHTLLPMELIMRVKKFSIPKSMVLVMMPFAPGTGKPTGTVYSLIKSK